MLYLVFFVCGFIFTFLLIALCLLNFVAGSYNEKEKTTFIAMIALLAICIPATLYLPRWNSLIAIPIAVIAGASVDSLNRRMKEKGIKSTSLWPTLIVAISIVANLLFVALMFATTLPPITLTTQYAGTMLWIRSNTATNSTFLTWSRDGAAIECWANRTTYTDGFDEYNQTRLYDFSRFLFAKAYNLSYLDDKAGLPSCTQILVHTKRGLGLFRG